MEKVGEETTAKYFVRGKVDGRKERREEGCIDGRKENNFIHLNKQYEASGGENQEPGLHHRVFKRLRSSVQFSSVVADSMRPHALQHTSLPCPSPIPRAYSDSCPSSWWCYPTVSSSVIPFSCLPSLPPSWSFPLSHFFTSGGQSIGVSASASVFPMNTQDWFPLGWTGLISLQSKWL